jgi:hypothetical protein
MEKERLQQPGVIHPIGQATDEFRGLGFSLDQIEAYAAREYGLDVSA